MPAPTTSAAGKPSGASSSSAGINVEGRGGVVYEQAVPEERRQDHEKERLRREMYERQRDVIGVFKPGPCSKFDPDQMMDHALCNHPYEHF